MYKLLVLDIDGTLISKSEEPISDIVAEAISSAKQRGVTVVLATGKSLERTMQYIKQLNLENSYSIVESGSRIIGPELKVLRLITIETEIVRKLSNMVGVLSESFRVCSNGHWTGINEIDDSDELTSCSFVCKSREQEEIILKKLKDFDEKKEFTYTVGSHWNGPSEGSVILFTKKEADKFYSVEYLKKLLNIQTDETIAVGDMENDIPMMNAAGLKVAVGNARDSVKEKADYVSPSVYENGVAEVIQKFIIK